MNLSVITWLVVAATSAWTYLDASGHRVGRVEGDASFANMSAGAWGFCVLGFWIVGFPAYLFNRRRLIERARKHPRESSYRGFKAAALAAPGLAIAVLTAAVSHVPSCGDALVLSLLRQILVPDGADISISFNAPGEVQAESVSTRRICRVEVTSPFGVEWIRYSVEPHGDGRVFVQVIGR